MIHEGIAVISYALFIASWFSGFLSGILAFVYFFETTRHIRPDKKYSVFLPYAVLFSAFFTEQGNKARKKLFKFIGYFLLSAAVAATSGLWNHHLKITSKGENAKSSSHVT